MTTWAERHSDSFRGNGLYFPLYLAWLESIAIDNASKNQSRAVILARQIEDLRQARRKIECHIVELEASRAEIDTTLLTLENELAQISSLNTEISSSQSTQESLFKDALFSPLFWNQVPSKLVTKESPIEDKFKLFLKLFSGRPDMHARCFETQDGRHGYGVVCSHKFKRGLCELANKSGKRFACVDCQHQEFPQISLEEFKAHRAGKSKTARLAHTCFYQRLRLKHHRGTPG